MKSFALSLPYKNGLGIEGLCDVEIYRSDTVTVVIITEREDNEGPSVTNTIEIIASLVYRKHLFPYAPERIRWVEHYLERPMGKFEMAPESWDAVVFGEYDPKAREFRRPEWSRISPDDAWFNRILDMRARAEE